MLEVNRWGWSAVHAAFAAEQGIEILDPAAALPAGAAPAGLSFQFFGEHCTECAAPDCHDSCDLFERGPAGLCRRFADGIVVRPAPGPFRYALEILFKPWGRLLAVGNTLCMPAALYRRRAWAVPAAGRASYALQAALWCLPARLQWRLTDRVRGAGNRVPRWLNGRAARGGGLPPSGLFYALGNPHREPVTVELTVSGFGDSQGGRAFRRTFALAPGWNHGWFAMDEIRALIDPSRLFRVCLVPQLESPRLLQVLYLGFAVRAEPVPAAVPATPPAGGKKIKALVTDLDNTLWDGILVESADGAVTLRPGVREALEELDRRGILLSIASRNHPEAVRAVLERFGLWDLFLYPQVSWEPKSPGVARIVERLNIGADTVAFMDDSPFERAEVAAALPAVRTYDAAAFRDLPALEEFTVPVTEDSRRRRLLYRAEEQRQTELAESRLDYDAFLRSCAIRLTLVPLSDANRERVHELVQRTNQLNFSGNRYTRDDLAAIAADPRRVSVVMECADRFGAYGIVGFAILRGEPGFVEVEDMMFSCRVQGKKVEHSFLAHVAGVARAGGGRPLACRFNRTQRNAPAAAVFGDLAFGMRPENRPTLDAATALPESRPVSVDDQIGLGKSLR
jgi:FkbH-like protein